MSCTRSQNDLDCPYTSQYGISWKGDGAWKYERWGGYKPIAGVKGDNNRRCYTLVPASPSTGPATPSTVPSSPSTVPAPPSTVPSSPSTVPANPTPKPANPSTMP